MTSLCLSIYLGTAPDGPGDLYFPRSPVPPHPPELLSDPDRTPTPPLPILIMDELKEAPGVDEGAAAAAAAAAGISVVSPGVVGGGQGSPRSSGGAAATAHYSIPGILHFLQHEWSRFEMERSQWEVEKAELQVRVFFLLLFRA